jgi:hypothetical protein
MMNQRRHGMKRLLAGLIIGAATLGASVAQDSWSTHRGSNQRTGTTTNARSSAIDFLLAWTLPAIDALQAPVITDNDNRTRASRAGRWRVPSRDERAADFYQADPDSTEPYVYAETIREPLPDQPIPLESRFTWRSGPVKPGYYRIRVHIPAQPTKIGQTERPYARSALYLVTTGAQSERRVFLNQAARGGWIQLGDVVYHNGEGEIVVTLTNLVVRNSPDYDEDPPRIVVADAVEFVPDYGTVQASPVAIRSPLDLDDGNTHLVYFANGNGTITCVENPVGTRGARVRWTFRVPDLPTQGIGQIYDDDTNFTQGQFASNDALTDRYGDRYYEIAPTNDPNNIARAFWSVRPPETGLYYVFAWFPSDPQNARRTEYVIDHVGGSTRIRVDQRFGGQWVLLNRTPVQMREGESYDISVNNYSPDDVRDGAQRVIADAIRIVKADGLTNAVFSTPAVGQVRVYDGGSTHTRWVVVFGAQNGAVYAIDALGDGQNGTRPGETKLYWIVKPPNSASFSYAAPLILEERNLVAIGNPAGAVYLIRTDFDPNLPPERRNPFKWIYNRVGAAFVSTPAYDATTGLIYIGTSEGRGQFGRIIALNPEVERDNPNTPEDERVAWVYPRENAPPKEVLAVNAVTSTPAVWQGRVYFTTSSVNQGRVFALDARAGTLQWRYPPAPPSDNQPDDKYLPLPPYSSPLVVPDLDYGATRVPVALYVCGADGRVYGLDASRGTLLGADTQDRSDDYISERLGGAIFSSPVFTYVRDTDEQGNVRGEYPAVVLATDFGLLLALHADDRTNARGGKAFEGWDLYGSAAFASPAVLDNWLYAADNNGVVYAYNIRGVANAGEAGELIEEPTPTPEGPEPDGSDYSKLKVMALLYQEDLNEILNGERNPEDLAGNPTLVFPEALEWGQVFYVIVWNFKRTSNNSSTLTITINGPHNVNKSIQLTDFRRLPTPPNRDLPEYDGIFWARVEVRPEASCAWTPGRGYRIGIIYNRGGGQSDAVPDADLNWATPDVIDRPGRNAPDESDPKEAWVFGVANPLGLRGIGAVGNGNAEQNLELGNATAVFTNFNGSPTGIGNHGQSTTGVFEVFDRRRYLPEVEYRSIAISVRALVDDLRWQRGAPSTILPWEVPPSLPNRSPDYPDIAGRRLQMLFEGASDLQRVPGRTLPTGNNVIAEIEVPRYQPANENGYLSQARIYVDINNNGRLDGAESLEPAEPGERRITEAFRVLSTNLSVAADPRMSVEEQTIDFGSLPGGFGFNWGSLFANDPLSAFRPDNAIFQPFWKPFTVRNEGNVNLYPVYLGKARGSPSGTVFLFSDMVSFFAGMPAWTTVASTLDPRFWPQPNPFYPGNNQPYPILQKPQVGDYTSTVLTQPAIPPRRDPNIRVDPRKPEVSIAIPPFQPMGVYSQLIAPYQHNDDGTPGAVNGAFATPPMRVVVRVRETQLTGSTNQGVVPMIDPVPPANAPRISDITPAAFRDPTTGKLHLYWASNRPDPAGRPNSFYLYKSTLDWNGRQTLQNNIRATNGWRPNAPNRWWEEVLGPYPNDPNGNLFSTALGLGRPLTDAEIATIKHHRPFVRLTPQGAFLFWTGEVILRNQKYELLFYVPVGTGTGAPLGNPRAVPLDPVAPRSSLSIAGVDGVGNWLFYVTAPSGRSQIFYIASAGDTFASWRREQRLPLSPIVRSVESVSANIYRVSANNTNFIYLADVYFIGTVGDRNESEVLLQRFCVNPNTEQRSSLNLFSFTDNRLSGFLTEAQIGFLRERLLPRVVDEVAQKDADQNVWRVRHLDWAFVGSGWNSNPDAPDIDIKINGVSILLTRSADNQLVVQRPIVDEQTGLLQFEFNQPDDRRDLIPSGRIVIDPNNGTIRFVNFAPRLNDLVTVTYRPRVYRISATAPGSAGSYSQLRAIFQRTMNPRHRLDALGESPVRKGENNGACALTDRPPVDRVWVFFRRTSAPPNSSGNFFFKTLRPGVRLQAPILTQFGRVPVQTGAFTLAQGTNHVVVQHVAGAGLGFYEYDALRGNIYFTTEDIGKEVQVRYLARDRAGNIVELEERQVVRWIDEGNLARSFATDVEYTSPVPIDLPTNELYLWAMPNVEFRAPGSLFGDIYGGLDESLLLFWSSTRNGVGNLYGGAMQPRFYISPFDPDQD